MDPQRPLTLIVIPFSHFCEKARWGLQWMGIPFEERGYMPLLHVFVSKKYGGVRTLPVLLAGQQTLTSSPDILTWGSTQGSRSLYPESCNPEAIRELELFFDRGIGPATRRWAYFHILKQRKAALFLMRQQVGFVQRAMVTLCFPLIASAIRRALRINPEGVDRSLAKINQAFDRVEQLLEDGRPYLAGDQISAADLTFASLAWPVLFPAEIPIELPPIDAFPSDVAKQIQQWRERPAGQFALELYRTHRDGHNA